MKAVLEQVRRAELFGDKVDTLKGQLASINKTEKIDSLSPFQEQFSSLFKLYQNGWFGENDTLRELACVTGDEMMVESSE